ncbi:MAG: signal peptidase I [Bacilli bacterium]|nr:signal peptidase I [Bacilli bacterium]
MKKLFVLYGLLSIYLLLNVFVLSPMNFPLYNEIINPFVWMFIMGCSIYLSMDSGLRIKGARDKTQSLIISLIIYIIVYFLLGLIFGFEKTPYAKDVLSILKNLWSFGSVIVCQEIVRESVIKENKKKTFNFIFVTIMFILINVNFTNYFSHFVDVKTTFIYVSTTIIPSIFEGALLTYLVYTGGSRNGIIYRLFMVVPQFIVPIIPDLDWFATSVIGVTLPIAIFIYLNYIHVYRSQRLTKRERKKYNPAIYVPLFVLIVLAAGFVIGLFKYQPIAVVSGSMSPTFNRGDAVVIEKLNTQEKNQLKKGDVIQFVSGTKYVIHRIVDEGNDEYGNKLFTTKGDYNNAPDVDKVHLKDIKGKVSFIVPYVGYPSVWLSGAIS